MGGKALGGRKITNQEAFELTEKIILENNLGCKVKKILLCGSARRGKKQSGDLDFVFIDRNDAAKQWLIETFGYKKNGKPQTTGLIDGVQVEFYEATPETWGSSVLMWTGSVWTNIRLRKKAVKKGWKLSQHGLFAGDVNLAANKTEEEIFSLLETSYKEPNKR
jgi:DNA polymerase (family 10)